MAAEPQKLKILYLAQLLFQETDEKHGVTMAQIIEYLAEKGIKAERKSLYKDIEALRTFGMDVVKLHTAPASYALGSRPLSQAELILLIDAVQSSKFLTKSKSDDLVRSIRSFGSRRQSKDLVKRLHVEGRIKTLNESVYYNVDAIQSAISNHRKVVFKYFGYDVKKKRVMRRGGREYVETPVSLIYSDGSYYLIAFNDKHGSFVTYRVDRMTDIRVSDEPSTRNEAIASFDVSDYESRVFGMFSGEPTTAVLLVQESAMGSIIDRFGKNVHSFPLEEGLARVTVQVMESPTFFSWLTQFGTSVKLEAPMALRQAYVNFLDQIREAY